MVSMILRRYIDGKDYPLILDWYKGWKMQPLSEEYFSTYGLIADNTFAAWLYVTDSKIAFIENSISNPNSTKEQRKVAIANVYNALFDQAKKQGFQIVMGFIANDRIGKNPEQIGCQAAQDRYYMLYKILKGE